MTTCKVFSITELIEEINTGIDFAINSIEPTEWDEDHISFSIISTIRTTLKNTKISQSRYIENNNPEKIEVPLEAQIYKVTGKPEATHGDICVIVHNSNKNIIGTAFYEAKAESSDGNYPAFKMRQFQKLRSATPNLSLLLYEQKPKEIIDDEYSLFDMSSCWKLMLKKQRARVFGGNIARNYKTPNHIQDIPNSLGYSFVTRNLTGKDLNYSKSPVSLIKKWLALTKRTPPVILNISVGNEFFMDPERKFHNEIVDSFGYCLCKERNIENDQSLIANDDNKTTFVVQKENELIKKL